MASNTQKNEMNTLGKKVSNAQQLREARKALCKLVDPLRKYKEARKMLDKKIETLENRFKEILQDGDEVEGTKYTAVLKSTQRDFCDPIGIYQATENNIEMFAKCVNVNNSAAKVIIGKEKFAQIAVKVPFQTKIEFTPKEVLK